MKQEKGRDEDGEGRDEAKERGEGGVKTENRRDEDRE